MSDNVSLLDHLQESGYTPEADELNMQFGDISSTTYELVVSGTGTVRLVDAGENGLDVYAFDRYLNMRWSARFASAPDAAIVGTLTAAEDELREMRGGPVTPRQEAG